jgi:ABC-type cobalamin/Fe3+-siderophores transport system ATPase subunit
MTLKIRNYRGIPYRKPLELEIGKGITFFLGPNNVGKTSLIRMFFELRSAISSLQPHATTEQVNLPVFADDLFNQDSAERKIEIEIASRTGELQIYIEPDGDQPKRYVVHTKQPKGWMEERTELQNELKVLFVESLFIPSIRPMTVRTHDQTIGDVTISDSLVSTISAWQTGSNLPRKREFAEFEAELGELFSAKEFRIDVGRGSGNLKIRLDGKFFGIEDLGDGLSHFIFVLANALFKKPAYILIDEPENGLHPRLQQTFIRALAAKSTRGLIAASHSIGLARSTADMIYTVAKEENGITVRAFGESHRYDPSITDTLHELGYAQFVEMGGDCILLVEGQTDIKAFREILRKFNVEQNFIIWHLGGSGFLDSGDVTHELMEVKRLNPKKVAVIFDSECTAANAPLAKKFQDFKDTAEKLGYLVFPTDLHSTENYISQSALNAVYPTSGYRALTPFEDFKTVQPRWGKKNNWKLFREMSRAEIEATGLGKFIGQHLLT